MTKPLALDPNLSQAERIDRVCTAFEAAWKTGEDQRPEDWLSDVSGAERVALAGELVLLEVHYRRRRGEMVEAREYHQRFPELQEAWLQEAVPSGQETAADHDTPAPDRPFGVPGALPETVRFSGDYELGEELGRGGMGVVYRGHDAGLGRTLAVKVLLEKHADNEDLKRRFLEEAQIMGQLQHPGVAPIHDIGSFADGRPFFSMKQIQGQTLAELLKAEGSGIRGQGSEPDAQARDPHQPDAQARGIASANQEQRLQNLPRLLGIFEQVCQTVAFAHSRRILHRDLKPANVMVGAFGEVQVMDWGLAKRIEDCRLQIADFQNSSASVASENLQSAISNLQCTEAGRVLGTPAYMAPEQARGEIEQLDERSDVFGLGAILCEVLTGRPPFPGDTQLDSHRMAIKSDLYDTFARLEGCGADAELVGLAQRCLAAEKEGRPRQAGEVAEALASYQTGVRERLQRAEVEGARAKVRAAEERRRRRVWLALAATVVVFALAGAGAGVWYYQYRAERALEEGRQAQQKEDLHRNLRNEFIEADKQHQSLRAQLGQPLAATRLLSDIDGWKAQVDKERNSWNRAKLLADNGKDLMEASWLDQLATLDRQTRADEEDWAWAKKLDDVRLRGSTPVEGKWNPWIVAKEYPRLFLRMGLDMEQGDQAQLAEQIIKSPLRYALVAALDHWALRSQKEDKPARLLAVARRADPDPWRDQVRDIEIRRDLSRLLGLAKTPGLDQQTPQLLLLLAHKVGSAATKKEALALMRQALFHHPKDFWLHFELCKFAEDPGEQIGSCWAALALRPKTSPAHVNLGMVLWTSMKDTDGAIQHFLKAIELDPRFALPHCNLGRVLHAKKDLRGALPHLLKAIELDPESGLPHYHLAHILHAEKDLDGAIKHFRIAIDLDPTFPDAHNELGRALENNKDLDGAAEHFQKAIDLDANHVQGHTNLGKMLQEKNPDAAVWHYNKALAIDRNHVPAHLLLGDALRAKNDLKGAISQYREAIQIDPNDANAHDILGAALHEKKDLEEAIIHYRKAIQIDPNHVNAHYNLGCALRNKNDVDGAIEQYKQALALEPNLAMAHNNLGTLLYAKKNLDGAIEHLRKAIELDPRLTQPYFNLGDALAAKNDPDAAIQQYEKGLARYPNDAMGYYNIGKMLMRKEDMDGANKYFQKVVEIDSNYPKAHNDLGMTLALGSKKDLDGAAKHLHKAIELDPTDAETYCNLGFVLREQGRFAEALKVLHKGHELGNKTPGWRFPSAHWIKKCERLLELDRKLPAILKGNARPRDAVEQLELANLCLHYKKCHVAAAHFYAAALKAEPRLAGQHRYNAACAAALAAAGKGEDAGKLDIDEPAKLRRQALDWLRAELAVRKQQLQAKPKTAGQLHSILQHWRKDADLAGVREEKELAKLPEVERGQWRQFWREVEQVLDGVRKE